MCLCVRMYVGSLRSTGKYVHIQKRICIMHTHIRKSYASKSGAQGSRLMLLLAEFMHLASLYLPICISTYLPTYPPTYMHIHIHTYIHTYIYISDTYTYTYIRTHTHTYIYTQRPTSPHPQSSTSTIQSIHT